MVLLRAVFLLAASLELVKVQSQSRLYRGAQEVSSKTGHGVSPHSKLNFEYVDIPDEDNSARSIRQSSSDLSDLFAWEKKNSSKPTATQAAILQEVSQILPKQEFFFDMHPRHRLAVWKLRESLMRQRSPRQWRKMVKDLRDHEEMNPHVWLRAVVSSIVHRQDIPEMGVPPMAEVIPSLYFTTEVLDAVRSSMASSSKNDSQKCVIVDESVGKDNGRENLAWYWREDIMLNSHHYYWHVLYPQEGEKGPDRGGELFYWLHQDMLARFHSERLSVGLPILRAFNIKSGSRIPLAYNPHLREGNSGRNWSARPRFQQVSDINSDVRPGPVLVISLRNRTIQINQILNGISKGWLINRHGQPIYLNTTAGTNSLANIVEANARSENTEKFGVRGVHNSGHFIISLVTDPRNEQGTPPGVMGETSTAMRDVMFYPYHEYITSIFKKQKATLQSYKLRQGEWPLVLDGVSIKNFTVSTKNSPPNQLHTFWSSAKYDLSRGLDFFRSPEKGPLWVCVKHLNHEDFQYDLSIMSPESTASGTVRIFMGPRYDPNGRRYSLEEQRQLMFVLDKFKLDLKVGVNHILRNSTQTPLTIGFAQSLGELRNETNNFCGCGWPHHLLIPKGNRNGVSFDIFAIITNGEDTEEPTEDDEQSCRPAHIYCGLMGKKYPDQKPMGYPFDRKLFISDSDGNGSATLDNLARAVPNSAYAQVKVTHFNEFREKPRTKI